MNQKIRVSFVLEFPDDMHAEDVLSQARSTARLVGAENDPTVSFVQSRPTVGNVLSDISRVLVDAGFKDMGHVQRLPGSDLDIQRFLRDKKELVEIVSTDQPDKELIEALTDGDEE